MHPRQTAYAQPPKNTESEVKAQIVRWEITYILYIYSILPVLIIYYHSNLGITVSYAHYTFL